MMYQNISQCGFELLPSNDSSLITTLYSPGSSLSYLCHFFNVLFLNKEYLSSAIDCKLITVGDWRGLLNVGTNEGMGEKRETGGLRSCSMISNGPGYVDISLVITQPNVSFRFDD